VYYKRRTDSEEENGVRKVLTIQTAITITLKKKDDHTIERQPEGEKKSTS